MSSHHCLMNNDSYIMYMCHLLLILVRMNVGLFVIVL